MYKSIAVLITFVAFGITACSSNQYSLNSSSSNQVANLVKDKNSKNDHFQITLIHKINKVRSKGSFCGKKYFPAAQPLSIDKRLVKAALQHSQDMAKHGFLEHVSSNGDTLVERLINVNFEWKHIGENVAHNQRSIDELLEDWLSSPGHCSNIMSKDYTTTGAAQVDWYWTQVFAHPK